MYLECCQEQECCIFQQVGSEPMADFFDLFSLGEGEEVNSEIMDLYKIHKAKGSSKDEFLREAAKIPGVYVPSLYDIFYNGDGTVKEVKPKDGAPEKVVKRVISDLDKVAYPKSFVVPFIDVVHDRVTHEIFRGCIRGCRFCQAGFIYRPIREKQPDTINEQCKELIKNTGYDEISLCSLSSSDYTRIEELLTKLLEWTPKENVNMALPYWNGVNGFGTKLDALAPTVTPRPFGRSGHA